MGQEVVIGYESGHPDRPFVMGGLYHSEHTPPFASDGGLSTGTKTHSTTGGSADNYNELSFLDAKDAEEIKLQAERDQRLIVKNNRTTHVGYDELNSIGHDLTIEADVMMEIKVGASRVVLKPDSLTVESASILIHGNTTQLNPGNATKAKSKGASVKPDTTPVAKQAGPAVASPPVAIPAEEAAADDALPIEDIIAIEIESRYEFSVQDAWNDRCVLWTVDDDGGVYKASKPIAGSRYGGQGDAYFVVRFEGVIVGHHYSCMIDYGGGKTTSLFQHVYITNAMDIRE